MAQTTGTTTITRKPQDGKSPVAYEIVPERTVYTSDETNELPFRVYKIVGEERTLLHEEIEGGTYVLESVSSGDIFYHEETDMYVLSDSSTFYYGDNCTVVLHHSSDDVVLATFTWGFTQSGKQGTTFSIRKWEDVKVGDKFRVESAEDGVLISDIVIYTDANGVTSKWICKKAFTVRSSGSTTKDKTTPKVGSAYWKAFDHYYNVATDLVLADKAIIDNLLLNNMRAYPKDKDGNWDTENPNIKIDGTTGNIEVHSIEITPTQEMIDNKEYLKIVNSFAGPVFIFRFAFALVEISGQGITYRRNADDPLDPRQVSIDQNGIAIFDNEGRCPLRANFTNDLYILGRKVQWSGDTLVPTR